MVLDEKSGKMVPVLDASGQIVYETRTRVSRIMALQNDLALVLEAKTIRMEAPVPGRSYVGVEIPNKNSQLVTLREVLESKEYQKARDKSKLAMALGRDVAGLVRVGDLAKMPHLLIAGATGAGKSVMINAIIASILMQATPDDVRMSMVDPKMVELSMYNGIPHLLAPVVTEVDKVVALLKNGINEMERRYRLFSQLGVRNLDGYRKLRLQKIGQGDTSLNNLPSIVIIIDELADLMMAAPEEVESMICRLAQLARATGIHLIVATQRPSVDVITGLIKANIPTRISFMVSSAVDSRTIIDMGGAERLLGRGDMLYLPADAGRPERIQAAFLSDEEAQSLAEYWRNQIIEHALAVGEDPQVAQENAQAEPGWELKVEQNDEFGLEDDLLDRAEEVVREYGRASISLLQRRLKIGYSRAARLIDLLEDHGIIGQLEPGGRAREVYGSGNNHSGRGDGTSMADVADDIVEEERRRNEFLREQVSRHQSSIGSSRAPIDDD
jgi:DNA segregation ATPase FtsK/SpoIIIE-like protein